jgi:hypothetical protein
MVPDIELEQSKSAILCQKSTICATVLTYSQKRGAAGGGPTAGKYFSPVSGL